MLPKNGAAPPEERRILDPMLRVRVLRLGWFAGAIN
jgi:hypothetical protein